MSPHEIKIYQQLVVDAKLLRQKSLLTDQLEAIFVTAPMGSGKTIFINSKMDTSQHVVIATDDYIKLLKKQQPMLNSTELYQSSRRIGIAITDYLMDHRFPMIMEATGRNADSFEFIERLKATGYKIITYLVETPLDICLDRVEKRNLTAECPLDRELVGQAYRAYQHNLPLIMKISDQIIRIDGTK